MADADLTAAELRDVALELRRHAARHARTEAEMTAFLDRADEILAEVRESAATRNFRAAILMMN